MKTYRRLNVKLSFFFVVLFVLIAVGMGTLTFYINFSFNLSYSIDMLENCGKYVEQSIPADHIKYWLENGDDGFYDPIGSELEIIRRSFELSYLYVYKPVLDQEGNVLDEAIIIYDFNPEGTDPNKIYKFGDTITNLPEFEQLRKVYEIGKPKTSNDITTDREGDLLVTLYPICLDTGEVYAVAGLCAPVSDVKRLATRSSILLIVFFEVVIVIFAVAMLIYVNRRIIRPVKKLSSEMDSFVSGIGETDGILKFRDITDIRTNDEIEQMTDNFNSMAHSILNYTEDLKKITASSERLKAELDVAGSIRYALSADLQHPAFSGRSDFELFASLKNTVYNSCSFCNYFMIDEDHVFVVIGESVGTTLPGMLMSMLASTNICALAKMGVEPYRIAYETNESIASFEQSGMSMTVSALIVKIGLSDGEMKYVNAGMPPVILKRSGEAYEALTEEDMQFNLGEMRGVSFKQNTVHLNQGNTIFFTSYGVQDMKNDFGEKFSREGLLQAINDISHRDYPLSEMIGELDRRLDRFRGEAPSELDTTILGFRYFG